MEELDPQLYRRYMGGRNLALHFLLGELPPGIDPLGPENKLIFMTSVMTGAPVAGQGRHTGRGALAADRRAGRLAVRRLVGRRAQVRRLGRPDRRGSAAGPVYLSHRR